MFSRFRRSPEPGPEGSGAAKGNPGVCVRARIALADDGGSRTEEVDVVRTMARVLERHNRPATARETWLELDEAGYVVRPQLAEVHPLDKGGVRTITTVEVSHPELIPGGLFEYQHSTGNTAEESIDKGFDQWAQTDLVALLDAASPEARTCMTMILELPERDGRPARKRRAILGPVAHAVERPPSRPAQDGGEGESHPFCPCCLMTNTWKAFRDLIEGEGFYGLRLFAARYADGTPQADCRINGEDWPPGAKALREYVATWPDAGFEFRKQYVIWHDIPNVPAENR